MSVIAADPDLSRLHDRIPPELPNLVASVAEFGKDLFRVFPQRRNGIHAGQNPVDGARRDQRGELSAKKHSLKMGNMVGKKGFKL